MKDVVVRTIGEKLKLEQKEDGKHYSCPIDGQLLVQIDNDGNYHYMTSCSHFQWEQLSIACYIGIGDESNPNEIKQLRKNSIMTIFDDIWVYLLYPKQS